MKPRSFDQHTESCEAEPDFLPEGQQESRDMLALGAWAIAPILFEDPEFKKWYTREYDHRLELNRYNKTRNNVRNRVFEILKGHIRPDNEFTQFPVFEEDSLNAREEMGKFLLELLEIDVPMYERYLPLILECAANVPQRKQKKRPLGPQIHIIQ